MVDAPPPIDSLSAPLSQSAVPAPAKQVVERDIAHWKNLLLRGVGGMYFAFTVMTIGLLSVFPTKNLTLQAFVSFAVIGEFLAFLAFIGMGAIGFLRIRDSHINVNARKRSLIRLGIVTIPGIVVSLAAGFIVSREPVFVINILNPQNPDDFVAPVSVNYSVEEAVKYYRAKGLNPLKYQWDFEGDNKLNEETVVPNVTATYERDGVYSVAVRILMSNGSIRIVYRRLVLRQAVFTVVPTPPVIEQPVVFNISTLTDKPSDLVEVQWDFDGDGKVDEKSNTTTATFTYYKLGPVTVTATVQLQNKAQSTYRRTITVVEPDPLPFPVQIQTDPKFLVSPPKFGVLFHIVTKEPLAHVDWNFGDGQTAEGERVGHTFDNKGVFPVKAKVRSESGSIANLTQIVRVVDELQLTDLTFDGTPAVQGNRIVGEVPVNLNITPRTLTPLVKFFWEVPEASEVGSMDDTVQAVFRDEGVYHITLVAQDAENHVKRIPITVEVKPVAAAVTIKMEPESGLAPLRVKYDASETVIPNETITGFEWDFGDRSKTQFGAARAEHTYTEPGSYDVGLVVRTTSGKEFRATKAITVRPPLFRACIIPSRTSGPTPLGIQFSSKCSTGTPTKILWDFGDNAQSDVADPVHVFEGPGTYTVVLTIDDGKGLSSQDSLTITVQP